MSAAEKSEKRRFGRYFVYDFIKLTAAPGWLWFRPKIVYASEAARERIRGGALLIANHIGFFDPVYLHFAVWYRRLHFVCLEEFFKGRSRRFFEACQCIPINKNNPGVDSLREITAHLRAGELVCMFPEGQVNGSAEEMGAFKSGMVLMAMRGRAAIVPVYIKRREHWYQRLVMVIGERVDVAALCSSKRGVAGIEAAAASLRDKEEQLKIISEDN